MNTPDESVHTIRHLLPNSGRHFALSEAVHAMQRFYLTDHLIPTTPVTDEADSSEEEDDADVVIIVAGKYGKKADRYVEIGLFRSFGRFTQLEVSLRYPVTFRSAFLKNHLRLCESQADAPGFFSQFRSSSWYWRYRSVSAEQCTVRWRGAEEMASLYGEIIPYLSKNGVCFSCDCGDSFRSAENTSKMA